MRRKIMEATPADGVAFKHEVGERVVRPFDLFHQIDNLMHGEIVLRYGSEANYIQDGPALQYPELYAVRWDHTNTVEYGFFGFGLCKESGVVCEMKSHV
jgi:hypothetical protein